MAHRTFDYAAEREYYGAHAPTEALPYRHLEAYLTSWLAEGSELFHGATVLDIGAGEAVYSRLIMDLYEVRMVVASDLFPARMAAAAKASKGAPVVYVGANCFALPFPDATFDVVFGSLLLNQIPNLEDLVVEIARVLKPRGAYVGIEMNVSSPLTLWRFWTAYKSRNQYMLGARRVRAAFSGRGFATDVRYFWGRFPAVRSRFLATTMGIVARKEA